MNQRKPPGAPKVEVIRRSVSNPGGSPSPRPTAPIPTPRPRDLGKAPPSGGPSPARLGTSGHPSPRPSPRRGPPRAPPTLDQINALAKKERVPARIAKGDLEGKMRTHIWRKLHQEEAKRFQEAYDLMEKMPHLSLADAFGVLQSGRAPEEFLAKKARGQLKVSIREARAEVPNEAVSAFVQSLIHEKAELAIALAERTMFDILASEGPAAFVLERGGRLEKLQVVLIARRAAWEGVAPTLTRDPKLAKKPTGVTREPERRPVADPRPFRDHLGKPIDLQLRNGIRLTLPVQAVGPFDLLVGTSGAEMLVPLHAILKWGLPGSIPIDPA